MGKIKIEKEGEEVEGNGREGVEYRGVFVHQPPPPPLLFSRTKIRQVVLTTPHHTTPHHTISHHTTPHHITPHHTISHHTTPHHTISHHTISHHTTPHHTISHCTIITHPPEYPSHMISSSTKQHMVTAPSDSNRRDRARGTGRSGVG